MLWHVQVRTLEGVLLWDREDVEAQDVATARVRGVLATVALFGGRFRGQEVRAAAWPAVRQPAEAAPPPGEG